VNESIQGFELVGVGEDLRGHPGAVERAGFRAVGFGTEFGHDGRAKIRVFVHDAFGFLVGVGHGDTQRFKDLCDRGLAGADPAGQSDAQDGRLR
jgi:hypothetical protein